MPSMPRTPILLLTLLVALVLGAPAAGSPPPRAHAARIVELGSTADDPAPSCPGASCRAMTRTTGYEVFAGAVRKPAVAQVTGRIVAITFRLGDPTRKQVNFFNKTYGGTARARVGIVHFGPRLKNELVGVTDETHLEPYFGRTVQLALHSTLPIHKGEAVALSVPTWAPVLAVGLDRTSAWRSSRPRGGCSDFFTQTALLTVATPASFGCFYDTARLTYSATEVTYPRRNPQPNRRR